MRIKFILDGGFSEEASGNDFLPEGFTYDGTNSLLTERVTVKFKSGQCASIYKKDEGILWTRV